MISNEFNESNDPQKIIFWRDGWEGKAKGGCYLRNSLKEFVERLEAKNEKIVGIIFDGTYNLEILLEEK